jgi:hypothetical protein
MIPSYGFGGVIPTLGDTTVDIATFGGITALTMFFLFLRMYFHRL